LPACRSDKGRPSTSTSTPTIGWPDGERTEYRISTGEPLTASPVRGDRMRITGGSAGFSGAPV
jgi:hypothetical protein